MPTSEHCVPPPRFVTSTGSGEIHATAPYKHTDSARAGRGFVACFCGQTIELPPHPPDRILAGWHHYCRVCTQHLLAASNHHPPSPTNTYEPWLLELAHLDTDSPTTIPPSRWRDITCHQQRHGPTVLRLKPTASGIALLAPTPAAVTLLTAEQARHLRDELDSALLERETWPS